jgi:CHAD domain-containing protein
MPVPRMKAGLTSAKRLGAPLPATLAELVRAHLRAAARARARLKHPEDREALHDFRVALRRLRSLLRAYRPYAEIVPRRPRKRLRRITQATNPARDAEVQLAWLIRARLPAKARPAGVWFRKQIRTQRDAAYDALPVAAVKPFDRLHAELRKVLAPGAVARHSADDFSHVTARALADHAAALARAVAAIHTLSDVAAIHAARIEGKRLRYLIEPLAPAFPRARVLVRRMKAIQDRFGELHDLFVLAHAIEVAADEQAAEGAQQRVRQAWLAGSARLATDPALEVGLVALVRYVHGRAERLYAGIRQDYQGEPIAQLVESVDGLVQQLLVPGTRSRSARPRKPRG